MKILSLIFGLSFFSVSMPQGSIAQSQSTRVLTWKEHSQLAERLEKSGKLHDAAEQYEISFRKKPKKLALAERAADLFFKTRDYRKAIEYFALLKDNAKDFPKARWFYALSLKQNGQYDEANPEFIIFLNTLPEKDREKWSERVEEEIAGCTLGIRLSEKPDRLARVEHIFANSAENDRSPAPFADDILYFTAQNESGATHLLCTKLETGQWQSPDTVTSLPIARDAKFGNGAFSPDFTRYYYTQLDADEKGRSWSRLYCIRRTPQGWSSPVRLRDYINTENTNATQPHIVHVSGKREILYFVSDRKGGKGGTDIWYAIRDLRQDDIDFELPKNAGTIINTAGDEVTPYYDLDEGCLYFSSNGRPSLGGFDIFKSKGQETRWITPENLGFPLNSPADDAYFIKNRNAKTGFLVSNRLFGTEKLSSLDDDIFAFNLQPKTNRELLVQGAVLEKEFYKPLMQSRVALYEVRNNEEQRLLTEYNSTDGKFQFLIFPDKQYQIEVESDGYRATSVVISTRDSLQNADKVEASLILEKYVFAESALSPPVSLVKAAYISPKMKRETPKVGAVYKIQVSAKENVKESVHLHKLRRIEELGFFDFEKAPNGMTRTLLAYFETQQEAKEMLNMVKKRGFKDAFVVKYLNGARVSQ